jgi:nicotinate-nucleotide adenylyltransferase
MRIGILGGTFDPIHYGHIEMARSVQEFFRCDLSLLVPAYTPPHKRKPALTSSYHRYAMAVMATSDLDGMEVSTLELEAPSRPYTVQTVERLKDLYGDRAELFFIMGADSFRELETWRDYKKLVKICNIVVMTRPGYEFDLEERRSVFEVEIEDLRSGTATLEISEASTRVYLTNLMEKDISATVIREAAVEGHSIDHWVPKTVARYIAKYRLYQ